MKIVIFVIALLIVYSKASQDTKPQTNVEKADKFCRERPDFTAEEAKEAWMPDKEIKKGTGVYKFANCLLEELKLTGEGNTLNTDALRESIPDLLSMSIDSKDDVQTFSKICERCLKAVWKSGTALEQFLEARRCCLGIVAKELKHD